MDNSLPQARWPHPQSYTAARMSGSVWRPAVAAWLPPQSGGGIGRFAVCTAADCC